MLIDISDVVSSENREETVQVSLELTSFSTRLGDFPIIRCAPIELQIANRENKRLLIRGDIDLTAVIDWMSFV